MLQIVHAVCTVKNDLFVECFKEESLYNSKALIFSSGFVRKNTDFSILSFILSTVNFHPQVTSKPTLLQFIDLAFSDIVLQCRCIS